MKCPKCEDEELRVTEDIFWEFAPHGRIEMEVAGFCPNCKHKYLWTHIYRLEEEKDLEDDE